MPIGNVPAPLTERERAQVGELAAAMSVTELLGQRFIIFVPGRTVTPGLEETIGAAQPAGFILYPWNYDNREDVRELTDALVARTRAATQGIDPIISVDQEGGRVAALRFDSLVRLPSAYNLAYFGDPLLVEAAGYITGVQLRDLGINMNLAPVFDVYGTPDDTIIGDRAYSGKPKEVAEMGTAFLRGLQGARVMAVAKHFPGHGVSTVDSHASLPRSEISLAELRDRHLPPFRAAVRAGVEVVMTAHIIYSQIDPSLPATLSPEVVRELLQEELGFQGVVMSDGVEMGALADNYNKREIVRNAFVSGVDLLLLFTRYDVLEMMEIARELLDEGEISTEQLRESARRVLEMKARYGLIPAVR